MAVEDGLLPEWVEKQGARVALLEYVIKKRVQNLEYLQKVVGEEGEGVLWMNSVRLAPGEVGRYLGGDDSRAVKGKLVPWFGLGVSLSAVLEVPNGEKFVQSVETLLTEWEYQHSSNMERLITGLKGGGSPSTPSPSSKLTSYQFLSVPTIPIALNWREVVLCLCTCCIFAYRKFLDHDSGVENPGILKKILWVDKKLKHHFFGLLSRELEKLAEDVIRRSQRTLSELFSSFQDSKDNKAHPAGLLFNTDDSPVSDTDDEYDNSPSDIAETARVI